MKTVPISRRNFLRIAALSGIGAGLVFFRRLTAPVEPLSYLRWKSRGLLQQNFAKPAVVGIETIQSTPPDIKKMIRQLWHNAELPEIKGARILIKPNLVDVAQERTATTDPLVVAALVDYLKESGAGEVKVGDGPAFHRDAFTVARHTGLINLLQQRNVKFVDLNYDDPQPVKPVDGWFPGRKQIWLPRSVLEADIVVSLAKMKTHHWTQVSLSMKNLLGIFPGSKYGWPKNFIHFSGITNTIMGIHALLPNVIGLVDGLVGMQGDGPLFGTPVQHGVLVAGNDLVAVDSVSKQVMGFGDYAIGYLNLASWAGVGHLNRIETRGVSLEKIKIDYRKPPSIQ